MITEGIIIAVITGITSLLGNYILNRREITKEKVNKVKREQYIDLVLENIEKKLDEHNHYAKKFGEVEIALTGIKKDIEYLRKDKK